MKWTSATALFLVLGTVGVGAAVVATRRPKDPAAILLDIRGRMADPLFDQAEAIRQLERAIDDSRLASDSETREKLLLTRANIYRDLDVHTKAREDLQRVLAGHPEGDADLEYQIAELLAAEGQLQQALLRTRALTDQFPSEGRAWQLRGQLEEALAMKGVEAARRITDYALSPDTAKRAGELILELAARHPLDPRRANLTFRIATLFGTMRESDLDQVFTTITEPRQNFLRARSDYATALGLSRAPSLVIAMADALDRAGRRDLAIRLQFAARNFEDVATDTDAVASLLSDLLDAGRVTEARALLLEWNWQSGGTIEFFRSAGEVLYAAEDYQALGRVAQGLATIGGQTGMRWSHFFRVVWPIKAPIDPQNLASRRQNLAQLLPALSDFARDDSYPEPFFGARKEALFLLAEAFRLLGNVDSERATLQRALAQDPDRSAGDWARYAETIREATQLTPWAQIEHALSMAMSLDPKRTALLESMWYEAGERMLERKGYALAEILDQVALSQTASPVTELGPSMLTKVAQAHLANERWTLAMRAAKDARHDYPNLVPPLDVIIAAKLSATSTPGVGVAADIVERIEAAGVDAKIEGFIARLPGGSLPNKWIGRAMRAAPTRFGKSAVARWHLARGEAEAAGAALAGIDDATAPAELRVLRSELLLEERKFADALVELDQVRDNPLVAPRIHALRVRALVGADRRADLAVAVQRVAETVPVTSREYLAVIDELLGGGEVALARSLVERMDMDAKSRTPDFYRRKLLIDVMVAGERGEAVARETITRAEPYLQDGSPQIAGLVLAVEERDWVELRGLARTIDGSDFEADPLRSVVLDLLGEKLAAGRRNADRGLEAFGRDPLWAIVAGAARAMVGAPIELPEWFGPDAAADLERLLRGPDQRNARDPRDVLTAVLVLDAPVWRPYLDRVTEHLLTDSQSSLFGPWLRVALAMRQGEVDAALAATENILSRHPQFGPAHDLAVAIAVEKHPTDPLHPSVVAARTRRVQSMTAKMVGDAIEVQIAVAGEAARQGKYAFAAQQLMPVIREGGPKETEGRLMLSLFLLRAGEPSLAALHLQEAAMKDLGSYREVAIDTLLEAIDRSLAGRAGKRGALSQEDALAMLDQLALEYPDDPLIALHRLRSQDVSEGERGERARGILRRFFALSADMPIDSLRAGATRAWVQFLAPIATEVAEELLDRELQLDPGNIELLQFSGKIAEIRGDKASARSDYETLIAIEPRADTGYALAELMIDEGADPAEVRRVLDLAGRLQGGGSARATYLRAVYDLRRAKPPLAELVPTLENLWSQRNSTRNEVSPVELGLVYMDALLRRGSPEDLSAVTGVAAGLRPLIERSLYESQYLTAIEGLVAQLLDVSQ